MAEGSLKMSIRVSQDERLNGGGPRPAAEKAVGLRYKPLPGSLRAGVVPPGSLRRGRRRYMDKRVPPCDARRVKDLKRAPRPKPVERARAQEPAAARERSQHTTQQTLRPRSEGGESG